MTAIEETCLARLEEQGRLINPAVRAASKLWPGCFVFRGELAIKFAPTREKEKRPPELKAEQVLLVAEAGSMPFFAAFLLSFESLAPLAETLDGLLSPEGKYFAFCSNIDLGSAYQVTLNGATFYILPLDESSVYNELLELVKLEKNDLKKLDSVGKVEAIANAVKKFGKKYEGISYERGLELMGPVKDPGENRPV